MQAQLDYVTQQLESDARGTAAAEALSSFTLTGLPTDASERDGYESDDGDLLDEGADHAQVNEADPLQLDLEQVRGSGDLQACVPNWSCSR